MAFTVSTTGDSEPPLELAAKKRVDDEIDITPMIDIVFLLLIFFVVASKMDPTQTAAVPAATHGTSVSSKDSAVIFMRRGGGDQAEVLRGDESPFSDDEEAQRSEIVDYVTQQLDLGKQQVMILGEKDVSVGEVARVQRVIGDAFESLGSTYIAVKEE
ncbi:ExbD/TolR family protein [Candidatus Laterigemmans baculatus]|uniref:ExbD/TolR family protein n=1 Tax=Candidatus Laterigemmans baculatus TaxID=2770505 RepID=UPI0013DCA45F|nr:biopolymer transporter ExbD [Candidatus Laterigemmans baculatus]